MKNKSIFLFLCVFFFSSSINIYAQKTRIAIAPIGGSKLMYLERKPFASKFHYLDIEIPIVPYAIESLEERLGDAYDIDIITPPDSIVNIKQKVSLLKDPDIISKELKKWAGEQTDYRYIIFLKSREVRYYINVGYLTFPEGTCGIVKEMLGAMRIYTGLIMPIYDSAKSIIIDTSPASGDFIRGIKKIKMPKDKKSFSDEQIEKLNAEFKALIDKNIEYSLTLQ